MVKLGLPCVYRPRVPYGRQGELFAFVTRVVDADKGVVDLIAFPANSEAVHYNNIARRGDKIQVHCWEPVAADGASADDGQVQALISMATEALTAEVASLKAGLDQLQKQMIKRDKQSAQAALPNT
jgi:hypothetical protein